MWSYGHAMSTHNIVYEIQNHTHNHDGHAHSHDHPNGNHDHIEHGDHVDYSLLDLIFCALSDYGHFLWDIEHGEHGQHFSLGLSHQDLMKDLANGTNVIPIHPVFVQFEFPKVETSLEVGIETIDRFRDRSVIQITQTPFRGPPAFSC